MDVSKMASLCSEASENIYKMKDSKDDNQYVIRSSNTSYYDKLSNKNKNRLFGFVRRERNRIYIVFRGTKPSSGGEWKQNVRDKLTKYPDPILNRERNDGQFRVHNGIYLEYDAIKDSLHQKLQILNNTYPENLEEPEIYVTGSSKGGALATICALEIANSVFNFSRISNRSNINVCTFMSPRVFNTFLSNYYDRILGQTTLRFFMENDPVPKHPDDGTSIVGTWRFGMSENQKQEYTYKHVRTGYRILEMAWNLNHHNIDGSYIASLKVLKGMYPGSWDLSRIRPVNNIVNLTEYYPERIIDEEWEGTGTLNRN